MKISSAFPSDYLKACDLQGRAVTVTMSHVSMAEIGGEPKPILYFHGKEKGLVVNKTNAGKIAEMFGDDTDDWTGGEIILYEAMVDFQGRTVPAIRVRLAPRKVENKINHTVADDKRDPISPNARARAEAVKTDDYSDDIPF